MKAKIIKANQQNGYNYSRDKELIAAYSVVGKVNGEFREIICARTYMGRSSSASVVYASIWVYGNGINCSGKGKAGGYGYHKESAAYAEAISSAGIALYGSQYSDENGMVWEDYPNPDYSDEAREAAFAESVEAGKRYCWKTPRSLRKQVKENLIKDADIGGCGDGSMIEAFKAIAKMVGARGELLVIRH